MFEKEAEDNKPPYAYCAFDTNCGIWEDGFKKGAEFGYNKANEWHYPSKGEYPKDDENFICMLENGYKLECYYDPTTKRWYDNFFHHDIEYGYYQSKVIAWKEIVLPELKENE